MEIQGKSHALLKHISSRDSLSSCRKGLDSVYKLRSLKELQRKYRQCTHKRNIEERSRNHCWRGKAICIKY